jgi:hypothetical protein
MAEIWEVKLFGPEGYEKAVKQLNRYIDAAAGNGVASIGGCNEPVMMAGDKTKQPTDGDLQDGRCAAVA